MPWLMDGVGRRPEQREARRQSGRWSLGIVCGEAQQSNIEGTLALNPKTVTRNDQFEAGRYFSNSWAEYDAGFVSLERPVVVSFNPRCRSAYRDSPTRN